MPKRKLESKNNNNSNDGNSNSNSNNRQSLRLKRKRLSLSQTSSVEDYSKLKEKEKEYANFINALSHAKYKSLAESLFITLKDEVSIIDEKYNLIEVIMDSVNSYKIKQEWINKVILKCNSKVNPRTLSVCASYYTPKTLQLLLSRRADPNGIIDSICEKSFTVISEVLDYCHRYTENLYWLIVYGGDVCINHECDGKNYFCSSLRFNKTILEWLQAQLSRAGPSYAKTIKTAIKNYRAAIKDMRSEVIEYFSVRKQTLIPDLYEIVFSYLAWHKN